jgi:hypothetical protein
MNKEIKKALKVAYKKDKLQLFELSFNCNNSFYEEPQNLDDYLDFVADYSDACLVNIINKFNQN